MGDCSNGPLRGPFRAFLPMDRAEAGGGADTDIRAAMRGLTLPLLAAAADAAKWPLGAPHADSVPATLWAPTPAGRQLGAMSRRSLRSCAAYLPAPSQSFSLKHGL